MESILRKSSRLKSKGAGILGPEFSCSCTLAVVISAGPSNLESSSSFSSAIGECEGAPSEGVGVERAPGPLGDSSLVEPTDSLLRRMLRSLLRFLLDGDCFLRLVVVERSSQRSSKPRSSMVSCCDVGPPLNLNTTPGYFRGLNGRRSTNHSGSSSLLSLEILRRSE